MNKNTQDVCDDICSDVWDRQTLSCNLTSYILLCATNQSLGRAYDRLSKLEPDNELERSNCYEFAGAGHQLNLLQIRLVQLFFPNRIFCFTRECHNSYKAERTGITLGYIMYKLVSKQGRFYESVTSRQTGSLTTYNTIHPWIASPVCLSVSPSEQDWVCSMTGRIQSKIVSCPIL